MSDQRPVDVASALRAIDVPAWIHVHIGLVRGQNTFASCYRCGGLCQPDTWTFGQDERLRMLRAFVSMHRQCGDSTQSGGSAETKKEGLGMLDRLVRWLVKRGWVHYYIHGAHTKCRKCNPEQQVEAQIGYWGESEI